MEIVEGAEFPLKAGDVLCVPACGKHTIVNRSDKALRDLGFMTNATGRPDKIEVK